MLEQLRARGGVSTGEVCASPQLYSYTVAAPHRVVVRFPYTKWLCSLFLLRWSSFLNRITRYACRVFFVMHLVAWIYPTGSIVRLHAGLTLAAVYSPNATCISNPARRWARKRGCVASSIPKKILEFVRTRGVSSCCHARCSTVQIRRHGGWDLCTNIEVTIDRSCCEPLTIRCRLLGLEGWEPKQLNTLCAHLLLDTAPAVLLYEPLLQTLHSSGGDCIEAGADMRRWPVGRVGGMA